MTDPQLDRTAIALFERLLDVPDDARAAWIEAHTDGRRDLRDRLRAMCDGDRLAAFQTGGAIDDASLQSPPDRIGAYRIVELIGRGGMGAVYRGERATGDFAHIVAIKLIRPGPLSDRLTERFAAERATLATLRHPHIAQLYDGGQLTDGTPYLIMEYVDGLPLMAWVGAHAPDRAERQRLFIDICSAVAFAHGRLIIHRDLTPSNVLVADGGTVKLIDFGISRPAEAAGVERTTSPEYSLASLSLTPGYAAPERLGGAEPTTAIDIFSLGRLLERLIPPGSADRELGAIIKRATAELPAGRYPTADALRADVVAWRDGLPVAAVSGGKAYVIAKFVRRHRIGVAAAGVALLLLMGAFGLTLLANVRAERARAAEARRFAEVRTLAHYQLFDLNDKLKRVAGNIGARADLAVQAQRYLTLLAASSGSRDDLKFETAQGLVRLARIQGSPTEPNLGQSEPAAANLLRAIALIDGLKDVRLADTAPTRAEARALHALILTEDQAEQAQAEKELGDASATLASVPPTDRTAAWFDARRTVRKAQLKFTDIADRFPAMRFLADRLEAEIAEWPPNVRASPAAAVDRAIAQYYRALRLSETKSDADQFGLPRFLDAERQFDALAAADPHEPVILYMATWNLIDGFAAASRLGDEVTSDRLIRKASATIDRLIAIDDRDQSVRKRAASIKEALAQNMRDHDQFMPAIALQREVLEMRRANIDARRNAKSVGDLGFSQMILGIIARDAGDRALACDSWHDAYQSWQELVRRKQVVGYVQAFMPGLQRKTTLCAQGVKLGGLMEPLR